MLKSRPLMRSLRRQLGGSLIEVLVSIVIASIGLLALAGVNAASARYAKLSQYRATATQLANDIGDRIRANRNSMVDPTTPGYSYSTTFSTQAGTISSAPTTCTTTGISCTAAQMAADDIAQWRQTVRAAMPEGSVSLIPSAPLANGATQIGVDVHVIWRDPAVDNADENPALAAECPNTVGRAGDLSIRCLYFRVNL